MGKTGNEGNLTWLNLVLWYGPYRMALKIVLCNEKFLINTPFIIYIFERFRKIMTSKFRQFSFGVGLTFSKITFRKISNPKKVHIFSQQPISYPFLKLQFSTTTTLYGEGPDHVELNLTKNSLHKFCENKIYRKKKL